MGTAGKKIKRLRLEAEHSPLLVPTSIMMEI
jgi:hypothetical protein